MTLRLKDKQTGEVDEYYLSTDPGYGVINASTGRFIGFDTLAELNEMFEDAPEEIKPFEEVAIVKETVTLGIGKHEDYKENQIKVADRDYYEILPDGTKKTEFTWDEAMEIEKKTHGKWRVPTQAEWFAIAAAFGADKDGRVTGEALAKNLDLTANEDGYGLFWSSTPDSNTNARSLVFSSTYVYPRRNSNKVYGFTVRCVAGEGE